MMHLSISNPSRTMGRTSVVSDPHQYQHQHHDLSSRLPLDYGGFRHSVSYQPSSSKLTSTSTSTSTTKDGGRKTITARIPMSPESRKKTIGSERQRIAVDDAKKKADSKDFEFFSRVFDGISLQNSSLEDGSSLKSTNESLLDNMLVRFHHRCHKNNGNNNNIDDDDDDDDDDEETLLSLEEEQRKKENDENWNDNDNQQQHQQQHQDQDQYRRSPHYDYDHYYSNLSNNKTQQLHNKDFSKIITTPAATTTNLSSSPTRMIAGTGTSFDLSSSSSSYHREEEEEEEEQQGNEEYNHHEENDDDYEEEGIFDLEL